MNNPLIFFLNTNGVFLLVLLILVLLFIQKKDREVFWHTIIVFCVTVVVVIILKQLFDLPRPFEVLPIEPQAGLAWFPSFPSAHTAIAFSVSTLVALHRKRLGIFCLIISALVAVGRVAGGVHYPIDVAFGMIIGVMIALFFDALHVRVRRTRRS